MCVRKNFGFPNLRSIAEHSRSCVINVRLEWIFVFDDAL